MLVPQLEPAGASAGPLLLVTVRGGEVVLSDIPPVDGDVIPHGLFVGTVDGRHCWAVDAGNGRSADRPASASGEGASAFVDLRRLYGMVAEPTWVAAGRAVQLVAWDRDHRYCGRCGHETEVVADERSRRCPDCGLTAFPRLSPAVIALVERDDGRALLARNARWPGPMYSCLAGFVEPGESIEGAARREILEEVGIEVGDLRYFSSQPWPFPHSLMLGFHADYAGGEITCDGSEIADAGWFGVDDLPQLPGPISIARHLIDDWITRTA